MARLTRPKDEWECRIAGTCPFEQWIEDLDVPEFWDIVEKDYCECCPFMKIINKLADYEDKYENELYNSSSTDVLEIMKKYGGRV